MEASTNCLEKVIAERASVEAELAELKAKHLEQTVQWDTKHDKLCQDGDANTQGEEDMMQAELEAMKEEYRLSRNMLQLEKKKLSDEALALHSELRRVSGEVT